MSEIVKKLAGFAKEAVDQFKNSDAPLDDSISKIASREDLNPQEISRLVEASNTLAWIETVKPQMDKTAEFKVASVAGVMDNLSAPLQKKASYDVDGVGYVVEDGFEKSASTQEAPSVSHLTTNERQAAFIAARNEHSRESELLKNASERREYDIRCLIEETKEALKTTIEKIAHECSKVGAEPFEDFEKRSYAIFKEAGLKPLIDLVYNECTFEKYASDRVDEPMQYAYNDKYLYKETLPVTLLKEASQYLKDIYNLARELHK